MTQGEIKMSAPPVFDDKQIFDVYQRAYVEIDRVLESPRYLAERATNIAREKGELKPGVPNPIEGHLIRHDAGVLKQLAYAVLYDFQIAQIDPADKIASANCFCGYMERILDVMRARYLERSKKEGANLEKLEEEYAVEATNLATAIECAAKALGIKPEFVQERSQREFETSKMIKTSNEIVAPPNNISFVERHEAEHGKCSKRAMG